MALRIMPASYKFAKWMCRFTLQISSTTRSLPQWVPSVSVWSAVLGRVHLMSIPTKSSSWKNGKLHPGRFNLWSTNSTNSTNRMMEQRLITMKFFDWLSSFQYFCLSFLHSAAAATATWTNRRIWHITYVVNNNELCMLRFDSKYRIYCCCA